MKSYTQGYKGHAIKVEINNNVVSFTFDGKSGNSYYLVADSKNSRRSIQPNQIEIKINEWKKKIDAQDILISDAIAHLENIGFKSSK
jgi:hypothetical protein